jgi:vacuolar-type H+-ATPase subunit C/Vma6
MDLNYLPISLYKMYLKHFLEYNNKTDFRENL